MKNSELKYREKPIPVQFKQTIQVDWYRKFTRWERIKIMFGYNFVVKLRMFVQHAPGHIQPIFKGETTKYDTAEDHVRHTEQEDTASEALQKEVAKNSAVE